MGSDQETDETKDRPTRWTDLAERAAREVSAWAERAAPVVSKLAEKAVPAAEKASDSARRMVIDLSGGLEQGVAQLTEKARELVARGQHTRVRVLFRGKVVTEMPIAALAAAQVASLWWLGPLRLLLGNALGKALLEVEFISDADPHVAAGRQWLADGDIEKALKEFDRALAIDKRSAAAYIGVGIACKLRGDVAGARAAFERARDSDPRGDLGTEALRHLAKLDAS